MELAQGAAVTAHTPMSLAALLLGERMLQPLSQKQARWLRDTCREYVNKHGFVAECLQANDYGTAFEIGGHIGFRVFPNQCGTLVRITVPTEQNRRESV